MRILPDVVDTAGEAFFASVVVGRRLVVVAWAINFGRNRQMTESCKVVGACAITLFWRC